jgi:methionyl-tRNA formyltransferase
MKNDIYIVATIKPWNIKVYNEIIKHYTGEWHLITEPSELTVEKIKLINPKFVFFPHWSHIVPNEILNITTCVCFHEADLPYGRGGSPLQNLISLGHRETVVTALKMSEELDAGPIYLKRPISLEGLAEEIFLRTAYVVAEMIKVIITENPIPFEQVGKPTLFKRRKPSESIIPEDKDNLIELYDHIRMLDAEGYPKAFLESGGFRFEISRPALKTSEILADVRIIILPKNWTEQ